MPYYRIKIWTKQQKKPFEGIRWLDNPFIDNVHRIYEAHAKSKFGYDYVDIEVQQLSKVCTAVVNHLKSEKNKRANLTITSVQMKCKHIHYS